MRQVAHQSTLTMTTKFSSSPARHLRTKERALGIPLSRGSLPAMRFCRLAASVVSSSRRTILRNLATAKTAGVDCLELPSNFALQLDGRDQLTLPRIRHSYSRYPYSYSRAAIDEATQGSVRCVDRVYFELQLVENKTIVNFSINSSRKHEFDSRHAIIFASRTDQRDGYLQAAISVHRQDELVDIEYGRGEREEVARDAYGICCCARIRSTEPPSGANSTIRRTSGSGPWRHCYE